MYAVLPRSEYYDDSVPSASSADVAPIPSPALWTRAGRGTIANGSHVHCCPVDGLDTRLYPCGLANGYAVDIHRGLPTQAEQTRPGVLRQS
jgi:hypothetical protein